MSHIFGRKQAPQPQPMPYQIPTSLPPQPAPVKTLTEAAAVAPASATTAPTPAPQVAPTPAGAAPVASPASSAPPVDPDYAARVAERDKNLADWAEHREEPVMTNEESNAVLSAFDWEPDLWIKWYHISAKEQLAMRNRHTTAAQMAYLIGEYNGAYGRHVGVPPGWVGSDCHKLRGD